jgi:hypothetical protein
MVRPRKLITPEQWSAFLAALGGGVGAYEASRRAGISYRTLVRRSAEDADLRAALVGARAALLEAEAARRGRRDAERGAERRHLAEVRVAFRLLEATRARSYNPSNAYHRLVRECVPEGRRAWVHERIMALLIARAEAGARPASPTAIGAASRDGPAPGTCPIPGRP